MHNGQTAVLQQWNRTTMVRCYSCLVVRTKVSNNQLSTSRKAETPTLMEIHWAMIGKWTIFEPSSNKMAISIFHIYWTAVSVSGGPRATSTFCRPANAYTNRFRTLSRAGLGRLSGVFWGLWAGSSSCWSACSRAKYTLTFLGKSTIFKSKTLLMWMKACRS